MNEKESFTPAAAAAGDVAGKRASTAKKRTREDEVVEQQKKKEKKLQQKKKPGLPDELWAKILEDLDDNSVTAFACVCKQLRRVQQASRRKLKANLGDWEKYNPDLGLSLFVQFSWNDHSLQRLLEKYRMLQKAQHPLSEKWCLWCLTLRGGRFKEASCIMNAAAFWGHLNLLKQWEEQDGAHKFNEQTCAYAAYGGHLEVLKYLRENGCPWDLGTIDAASQGGHFDIVKYAHENGCPWSENTCMNAAKKGHFEMLKYAHENGCPWHEGTCAQAAEKGHLQMLRYARENTPQCPWDQFVTLLAAIYGHKEVLKYARENGCKWTTMCASAAEGQLLFLDVLVYTRKSGLFDEFDSEEEIDFGF